MEFMMQFLVVLCVVLAVLWVREAESLRWPNASSYHAAWSVSSSEPPVQPISASARLTRSACSASVMAATTEAASLAGCIQSPAANV